MKQWILNRSIFFKFGCIFIITSILISTLIGVFLSKGLKTSTPFRKFIHGSFQIAIEKIGTPPNFEIAHRLSRELGIDIRFISFSTLPSWSTSRRLSRISINHSPKFKHFHQHPFSIFKNKDKKPHFFQFKTNEGIFLFSPIQPLGFIIRPIWFFLFLSSISILFLLNYWILRRIFYPLKGLQQATETIQRGNLESHIPVYCNDELGKLSESFNQMIKTLKNTLDAKDTLLLNVSHELRSPLTRMKLLLEFIKTSKEKKLLTQEVDIIETMITELLEMAKFKSKYGTLSLEQVPLKIWFESILENYTKYPISLNEIDTKWKATLDPDKMNIVIKNLLNNAIKYSSKRKEKIEIHVELKTSELNISIRDYGDGIPEEHIPFLFEPFYRSDPSRSKETGGYGLGLSICKEIIEAHQGKIKIKSTLGKGTTVYISLRS